MKSWAKALGLGAELVGLMALFLYAGQYLDVKYEWPGYALTFCGLFALIIWLTHVVIMTRQFEKEESGPTPGPPPET
jgi:hypothetical protein